MSLRNKKILITSGPTWVPLDPVRVISNIATGNTGIKLAESLSALGAKVTLLLGPVGEYIGDRRIIIRRFHFFGELKDALVSELKNKNYDIVIHSAAVSDYKPQKLEKKKIRSGMSKYRITLIPTEKIINLIKKISPNVTAVGFKFDLVSREALINKARDLLKKARLEVVVANTSVSGSYRAYLVTANNVSMLFSGKEDMNRALIKILNGKTE